MSGMSKEFLDWIFANGYCGGECYHGTQNCMNSDCDVVMMWPEIRYSTLRVGLPPKVITSTVVTIECCRKFTEENRPWGPPWSEMITHTLIIPMPESLRDSYDRERAEYIERDRLKEVERSTTQSTYAYGDVELLDKITAKAKIEHDKICNCDPKYLMSCTRMAQAILNTAKMKKDENAA